MPSSIEEEMAPSKSKNHIGDPGAIDNYEMAAADIEFVSIVAVDSGNVIGVSLTRRHFRESAELHLIAVDPKARG